MYLVVGATGHLGGEICRQLAGEGIPVRALVRAGSDPVALERLGALGIGTVEGDVRDRASLDAAVAGCDGVVSTISAMPFRYEAGVNDIASVDRDGLRHLIEAAVAGGVSRFVYTSFSGQINRPSPLRDAKRAVEGWLRESPLAWTILRPSYFMDAWLTPMVGFDPAAATATIYGAGMRPISWIAVRDVAAFAVASLRDPRTVRTILELGGPRPMTPLEVVRAFEMALGRPFTLTFVPEEALAAQAAAATDPMQQSFVALMQSYGDGDPIEMGTTARLLGRPMTTVEEYAAEIRAAVPAG